MTGIELGVALVFGVGLLLALFFLWRLYTRDVNDDASDFDVHFKQLMGASERSEKALREELERNRGAISEQNAQFRKELSAQLRDAGEHTNKQLSETRETIETRLQRIQQSNQEKLDEMRAVVDEKLQENLNKRFSEAFKQVSERLEKVHAGLGEMQTLAEGVGDLKRVLSNVKNRGTFGETRLEALLEQTLAPSQWQRQAAVIPGGSERVDFAIRMPGAEGDDDKPCWLPIDAKFPQEAYERLLRANEAGDAEAARVAATEIEKSIVKEARSVHEKYVSPPHTTDFAVIFLPTESLYAEVVRRPGLMERLQTDHRVTIAGPTTFLAILNSLHMGFRTLAIQKRSAEVWRVLSAVKTEFGKFGQILAKVEKKLQEASNTISSASSKTRNITQKLSRVETLPEGDAENILQLQEDEASEDDVEDKGESETL